MERTPFRRTAFPGLQKPVHTARLKLTNITRRTALRGATAAFAAVGLSSAHTAEAPASELRASLQTLIEAHRSAWTAYNHAIDAESDINTAIPDKEARSTPVSVSEDGSPAMGGVVLVSRFDDGAAARTSIAQFHENLRRTHCGGWAASAVPGHAERMAEAINDAEARAYQALHTSLADYRKWLADTGFEAA